MRNCEGQVVAQNAAGSRQADPRNEWQTIYGEEAWSTPHYMETLGYFERIS